MKSESSKKMKTKKKGGGKRSGGPENISVARGRKDDKKEASNLHDT